MNHYLKLSLLVSCWFGCSQASPFETSEKDKTYEKDRVKQARINQENADALAKFLAQQTEGFTHKELKDVIEQGVALALSSRDDKVVELHHFTTVIERIKNDPARILEREKGTWKHTFKTYFRNPKVIPLAATAIGLSYAYNNIVNRKNSITN